MQKEEKEILKQGLECKHVNACEAGRYRDEGTQILYAHIICFDCNILWKEEVLGNKEEYKRCNISMEW